MGDPAPGTGRHGRRDAGRHTGRQSRTRALHLQGHHLSPRRAGRGHEHGRRGIHLLVHPPPVRFAVWPRRRCRPLAQARTSTSTGDTHGTCKKRVTWSCLLVSHVGYAVDAGAVIRRRWSLLLKETQLTAFSLQKMYLPFGQAETLPHNGGGIPCVSNEAAMSMS